MDEAMTVRMRHGTMTGSDVLLYKNPKDLYIVWKEWEFGLNVVKPARDFTPIREVRLSLHIVGARHFGMWSF